MRPEVMPPLKGRWARADAAILVPAAAPGYILLLVFCPNSASPSLTFLDEASPWQSSARLHPGVWQWLILPLPPEKNRAAWLRIQVQPSWDPRKASFPPDLGVFFGKVILAQD